MAEKLIPKQVAGRKLSDSLLVGLTKVASEKLIAQTPIGNGNMMSGAVKLLGAGVIPNGKYSGFLKDAMGIDAIEDFSKVVFDFIGGQDLFSGQAKQNGKNNTI